jgi:uncharacterized protein YoxC
MIEEDPETIDPTALAVAGLTATVKALNSTTERGFKGISDRLDTQNGRLGRVEERTTEIKATMVTTNVCEKIRRKISETVGESWKRFLIPVAVALAVLGLSKLWGS